MQAGDIEFRENLTFWHSMNCLFVTELKNDPNVCTFHGKPLQDGDLQNFSVRHWFDLKSKFHVQDQLFFIYFKDCVLWLAITLLDPLWSVLVRALSNIRSNVTCKRQCNPCEGMSLYNTWNEM